MDYGAIAWAISVCDRAAGRHPAWEAPPPRARVEQAKALLFYAGLWDYTEAKLATGRPLPRAASTESPPDFEKRYRDLSLHDVDGWWEAVVSAKSVCAATMTAAFVQRAGGQPGVALAEHLRVDTPIVPAEGRVKVVDAATWQAVIPRGVMRGENSAVEIVGGAGSCHQETVRRSRWRIVGGWQVANGPNRRGVRPAGAAVQEARIGLPIQKLKV